MKKGCLHLLPSLLDPDARLEDSISPVIYDVLESLDAFFVETPKVARAYLKKFEKPYYKLEMLEVDKRTRDFSEHIMMLESGKNVGLLSDAGLPCLADPGARLVDAAHKANIQVKAHVGPSSIYLALMHSGFYAQKFTFHGYFPKELKADFIDPGVHVFIETPFRAKYTLISLLEVLDKNDRVMIAVNLTGPKERIIRGRAHELKTQEIDIHKQESIFVIEVQGQERKPQATKRTFTHKGFKRKRSKRQ